MKFMHISDIHLGRLFKDSSFKKFASKRAKELEDSFFNVLSEFNKDNDINILLISGDTFDTNNVRKELLLDVENALNKVTKPVFIITGNHDPYVEEHTFDNMKLNSNIHVFKPNDNFNNEYIEVTELNLRIYGHSWKNQKIKDRVLNTNYNIDKNYINILLAHADNQQQSEYLPLDMKQILKQGFNYIALGHIHKPMKVEKNILYPGSLLALDFSECKNGETHGYVVGDITNNSINTQFIEVQNKRMFYKELILEVSNTSRDVINMINDLDTTSIRKDSYYRVVLKGKISRDINLDIKDILSNLSNFYYIEIKDETEIDFDFVQLKFEYKGTIIENIITHYEKLGLDVPLHQKALEVCLKELLN